MQIELLVAKTICESLAARDHLGAHHGGIKRVRAGPIGDVHDTVIERDLRSHEIPHLFPVPRGNKFGNSAFYG